MRTHMQNPRVSSGLLLSIALILIAFLIRGEYAQQSGGSETQGRPTDAAVQKRVEQLLQQMTLSEKIGQTAQLFMFGKSPAIEDSVRKGGIGSLLFVTDPAEINRLQHMAVEGSRLHIPLLFGFDVIHGFRTIFPVPIAMASSWDPAMVERAQSIAANEASSVGIRWSFAPMVDIARDPRWGRIVEGAGEDPYLGSAIAGAQVHGFQGPYIGAPDHVIACMKHFAGYGAAEGGRDYESSYISESQMWNVYLPPFHAAVDAGIGSAMSAYMDLNDVPATGNRWLLHDVLREDWKFRGFVVSDAMAVQSLVNHGFAADQEDASVRALTAGVNMEMAFGSAAYSRTLPDALKQGRVTVAQIDDAVRPILETKIRLGLFEHPYVDEARARQVLRSPDHRQAAMLAAERSAVLLKNQGNLLPLSKTAYKKIAVIGPLAGSKVNTLGSWAFAEDLDETVTVFEGIRKKLGSASDVNLAEGVQIGRKLPSPFGALAKERSMPWTESQARQEFDKAVDLVRSSDIAILALGELQDMSGESASRSSLDLPGREEELLEAIVATGKPVVIVLLNGRPLDITWVTQHAGAILEAWYPGTQGGAAVANLLFGDAVPGGKLPITWPRNVGQVPIYYGHNLTQDRENQGKRYWNEESTPLFPFGYGLSYATFSFSNLTVARPEIKPGESVEVSVDVENTSGVAGDEVAQLYIHQGAGSASRPVRELKGFERVTLAPHEKKTVHFSLGKEELSYWSSASRSWVEDAATFDVWVGTDSTASLHSAFKVAK
jgi:beta-glucosidase